MIIDGEKYACEACVRGHRVSNCRHEDRPLLHIQKKGRPISQCQHCRAARKTRSTHTKCDCGEKTTKCPHLQPPREGHTETCCCNHGQRCTCAHKKDLPVNGNADFVESDPERPVAGMSKAVAGSTGTSRRRRAHTSHAESVSSAAAKARLSPNRSSQSLKRGVTMHGTGAVVSQTSRSVDNLAHFDRTQGTSTTSTSGRTARLARSEQASPMMTGASSLRQPNAQLPPPLDLSTIHFTDYSNMFNSPSEMDPDAPIFSARLSSSADWSSFDGPAGSSLDSIQHIPFDLNSGFNSGEPTLASNSGNVSETEDFGSPWNSVHFQTVGSLDSYADGLESVAINREVDGLDYDPSKEATTLEKFVPYANPVGSSATDEAFWAMNNFNDGFSMSPDPILDSVVDVMGHHMWDGSM